MGTISAATHLGGLVDLDVLDDQLLQIQALGLGVALDVLEESEDKLAALLGPAALGDTPDFGLGATAHTTVEAAEGNRLLVLHDVLEELLGLGQLHALDGHSGLSGVLEMNAQVFASGLAGLAQVIRLEGIDHLEGQGVSNGKHNGWLVQWWIRPSRLSRCGRGCDQSRCCIG